MLPAAYGAALAPLDGPVGPAHFPPIMNDDLIAGPHEMKHVESMDEMRIAAMQLIKPDHHVGFVPTMGGLHDGHLTLVDRCKAENDVVIVSIFVNPAQFAAGEDLDEYPRRLPDDITHCRDLNVHILFVPTDEAVYPSGALRAWTYTDVGEASVNPNAEGASRPTFFRGVATVLSKFLMLIKPDRMYCGQKDAQQCAVMQCMLNDLFRRTELVVCPIKREDDGLAKSSRNLYLHIIERQYANILFRTLNFGKNIYRGGERNADTLRRLMNEYVERWQVNLPAQVSFHLMYVSVCNRMTMEEVHGELVGDGMNIVCMAAKLGRARLIDNMILRMYDPPPPQQVVPQFEIPAAEAHEYQAPTTDPHEMDTPPGGV